MELIKKIGMLILFLIIIVALICLIISSLVSMYRFIVKGTPLAKSFKETFFYLFICIIDILSFI